MGLITAGAVAAAVFSYVCAGTEVKAVGNGGETHPYIDLYLIDLDRGTYCKSICTNEMGQPRRFWKIERVTPQSLVFRTRDDKYANSVILESESIDPRTLAHTHTFLSEANVAGYGTNKGFTHIVRSERKGRCAVGPSFPDPGKGQPPRR